MADPLPDTRTAITRGSFMTNRNRLTTYIIVGLVLGIAVGYVAVRKWLSRDEFTMDGRTRWTAAGIIALASPFVLLWG